MDEGDSAMTDEDITPAGSVVPVFLDPTPKEPSPVFDLEAEAEARQLLRQSGIDKLMALGLSEDEAKAIAGI